MKISGLLVKSFLMLVLAITPTAFLMWELSRVANENQRQNSLEYEGFVDLGKMTLPIDDPDEYIKWWKKNELVADSFEIILDSSAETYFLGRIVTNDIPQMMHHLSLIKAKYDPKTSVSDEVRYIVQTVKLNTRIIDEELNKAYFNLKDNTEFRAILIAKISEWEGIKDRIVQVLGAINVRASQPEFTQVIKGLFDFRKELLEISKKLVQLHNSDIRNAYLNRLMMSMILSVLALLLATVIFKQVVRKIKADDAEIHTKDILLERSSRLALLGELTSAIGHEIANPLTVLSASMDQLKSKISRSGTLSPEELQTHHERISRAIQKMVTILNTIRNMIKEDPDAKLHPIKVQDVVNESLLLLSHLQEKYSVQIVVDPGIQDLKVLGRTTEVTQVISNLIKNAIEAMVNSQQRKLMITQEIHDQEVIVSFTDTWPGVPEKMKDQIFDPLFSTKTASGGTCLGLSISRKLAQRIGGRLFLDPQQPEVGARFCISLQRY